MVETKKTTAGVVAETFEENFKKLEVLAQELQNNRVSVDALVPRMKQALASIKVCKEILKETRSQLTEIGKEFAELDTVDPVSQKNSEA
jgi:exodeoxyribonuclease VII small subunit